MFWVVDYLHRLLQSHQLLWEEVMSPMTIRSICYFITCESGIQVPEFIFFASIHKDFIALNHTLHSSRHAYVPSNMLNHEKYL